MTAGIALVAVGILGFGAWSKLRPRPGERVPGQGTTHIQIGQSHPAYNSNPPTSGWHPPQTVQWGLPRTEIPDEFAVHNLEHGGTWITYQDPRDGNLVANLQVMDWAALIGRRARPDFWDAFSVQIPFFPDPVLMTPLQANFPGWWANRDGQAMLELLKRHTNPAVRVEIWSRLQKLWYEDAGSLRIGEFFEMHVQRKELKGFFEAPTNTWWNAYLEIR